MQLVLHEETQREVTPWFAFPVTRRPGTGLFLLQPASCIQQR